MAFLNLQLRTLVITFWSLMFAISLAKPKTTSSQLFSFY